MDRVGSQDSIGRMETGHGRPRAGASLLSRSVEGFVVTEATYPANTHVPVHTHETAGLAVVLTGGYHKYMANADHQCVRGMLTVEPPSVPHGEAYGQVGARAILFEIRPPFLARLTDTMSCLDQPLCVRDSAAVSIGQRATRELRIADTASSLGLEGLAFELLAIIERTTIRSGRAPTWLARVRERLHDDFLHSVALPDLARTASVHPTHLAHVFRAHEGCSVGEYVRRLRVAWAADKLTTTCLPLVSIAQMAGFADQSHFTRVFTHRMGVSPARYRAGVQVHV